MYLPADANCLISCFDHCIRSKDYVNVIVASKHPSHQWLNMKEAVENLTDEYKLKVKLYKTCEELYVELSDYIIPNSVVAVKASRGMKFENIVSKIIELV